MAQINEIWLDGNIIPAERTINGLSRAIALGDGFFETMFWAGGKGLRLAHFHQARFEKTAQSLGLPASWTAATKGVAEIIAALSLDNHFLAVRLSVLAPFGPRGLKRPQSLTPHMMVSLFDYGQSAPPPRAPFSLVTTGQVRSGANPSCRYKSLSYIDQVIGAQNLGQAEAGLFYGLPENPAEWPENMGQDPIISCISAANIYIHNGQEWRTPTITDGALGGVVRAFLVDQKIVREVRIHRSDVISAKAVCATNALSLVTEIIGLDGLALGQNRALMGDISDGLAQI